MDHENIPLCAVQETLEHERAWELRPRDPAQRDTFILYCPLCSCEVGVRGNGASRSRGRGKTAHPKARPDSLHCASCGRDLPHLPAPYPPQKLCAFCAKFTRSPNGSRQAPLPSA